MLFCTIVDYRRCLSPCRRRVPCIPVRLIVSSYCIPVSFAIFAKFLPFLWGLVVSVFSHFLLAWSLRGFSQWFFTRRIPKVRRNSNLVDLKKCNVAKCVFSRYRSCRYRRERASQKFQVICSLVQSYPYYSRSNEGLF